MAVFGLALKIQGLACMGGAYGLLTRFDRESAPEGPTKEIIRDAWSTQFAVGMR